VEQRKALDRLGLKAPIIHISFDDMVNHLNEQIQFAFIIGAKYIVLSHNAEELRRVNGKYILDRVFDNVGSDLLKAELDLGWIKKAGADPIEVLKSYKG
jgi:sugar phosphate isomerase/epimerase